MLSCKSYTEFPGFYPGTKPGAEWLTKVNHTQGIFIASCLSSVTENKIKKKAIHSEHQKDQAGCQRGAGYFHSTDLFVLAKIFLIF